MTWAKHLQLLFARQDTGSHSGDGGVAEALVTIFNGALVLRTRERRDGRSLRISLVGVIADRGIACPFDFGFE